MGMETQHVLNREALFCAIRENMPELILFDINMPEEQGSAILVDLKQDENTKGVKTAFLTSAKEPWPGFTGSVEDVSKELGADAFLQKTEDLNILADKIKSLLEGKKSSGAKKESVEPEEPEEEPKKEGEEEAGKNKK